MFAIPLSSTAGVVVGATSVTSPQGALTGYPLNNIINQSGLSAGYTSGVTDFATYTASTTHSSLFSGVTGFTGMATNGPQQFSFDLGSTLTIDAISIWNTFSVGAITSLELYWDNDNNWGNGVGGQLVGPSALTPSDASAQVYGFDVVATQFIHINALSSLQAPDFYGLGEVVMSQAAAVPTPSIAALMGLGLIGLGFTRRRRQDRLPG